LVEDENIQAFSDAILTANTQLAVIDENLSGLMARIEKRNKRRMRR
jgi:hypothetical protein